VIFRLSLLLPTIFLVFCGRAVAQVGPDPYYKTKTPIKTEEDGEPPPPNLEELEKNSASEQGFGDSGDDKEEHDEEDLSLSFAEMRDRVNAGVSLDLGSTRLRELIAFSFIFKYSADWMITGNIGSGRWVMDGEQGKKTYRLRSDAKDLGVGLRYYFTEISGFYLESNLTYLLWKGRIEPTGTNEVEEETVKSKLDSSFSNSGPALGLKLGWTTAWENGFYIDYCLFGAAKPWIVSEDYTENTAESKRAVRKELQSPQIWGLINIGMGYLF
jgi:hypothetical protein